MRKHTATYWVFQITGWSIYCLAFTFFYLTNRTATDHPFLFEQLITHVLIGLLLTHVMRLVIHRTGMLRLSFKKQVLAFTLLSLLFSLLIGVLIVATEIVMKIQSQQLAAHGFLNIAVRFAFAYFHFILLWNLIYFTYHYIQKTKQQQIDHARLESLLKELEIKTLKSHINPHFIFNSLNSIRALVVEDPVRARSAITQLSNILRNSMQVDKNERTPFENELNIVKDYLALEHLRLEERLRLSFDIEEDTLDHTVPPMILQTLVEYALKHGITNEVNGGSLRIESIDTNTHHQFSIQSTGNFKQYISVENTGINSIRNQLALLYGEEADFSLLQTKNAVINARIQIPL
ncbi:MAG: histidine kinase [Sediminibacterium sp.]